MIDKDEWKLENKQVIQKASRQAAAASTATFVCSRGIVNETGVSMKKKVKKLEIYRETVSNLTRHDLKKIAGGSLTTSSCTVPRSCCISSCDICTEC